MTFFPFALRISAIDHPSRLFLIWPRCKGLLVLGDEHARAAVADSQAITIDGCKLACATKMVKESGGEVAKDYAVLDVYRRYKQFKPQGIAELNEGGQKLAHALAEEIADGVVLPQWRQAS